MSTALDRLRKRLIDNEENEVKEVAGPAPVASGAAPAAGGSALERLQNRLSGAVNAYQENDAGLDRRDEELRRRGTSLLAEEWQKEQDYYSGLMQSADYGEKSRDSARLAQLTEPKYSLMTDEQKGLFNYLQNTAGDWKSNEYLEHIAWDLNRRQGQQEAQELQEKTGIAKLGGLAKQTTLDTVKNFGDNLERFGDMLEGDRMVKAPTVHEYASGYTRDSIESPLGKAAYDLATTTSNMLPSIGASIVSDIIAPGSGQLVGSALMGVASAGGTYADELRQGRASGGASRKAAVTGGLEALLQYVLGGVSHLGGKLTGGKIAKMVSNIDNVAKRIGARFVASGVSEGVEEYLQEMLAPVVSNWAYGENEDVPLFTEDGLYAFALAFASAGLLEGGSILTGEIKANEVGKAFTGTPEVLVQRAGQMGTDTEAYQLAQKFASGEIKANAANLGNLFIRYRQDGGDVRGLMQDVVAAAASKPQEMDTMEDTGEVPGSEILRRAAEEMAAGKVDAETLAEITRNSEALKELGVKLDDTMSGKAQRSAVEQAMQKYKPADKPGMGEAGVRSMKELSNAEQDAELYSRGFTAVYENSGTGREYTPEEREAIASLSAEQLEGAARAAAEDAGARQTSGLIRNEARRKAKLTARQADVIDRMGKALGVRISFVDRVAGGAANGRYVASNNTIEVALDSENPFMTVVKHEVTHRLQTLDKKSYEALRRYAVALEGSGAVKRQQELYAKLGMDPLSTEAAMDEVVCNFTEKILRDEDALQRLIREAQQDAEKRTAGEKLLDVIRKTGDKLSKAIARKELRAIGEAQYGEYFRLVERAERLWFNAFGKAAKAPKKRDGLENRADQEYNGGKNRRYSLKEDEYEKAEPRRETAEDFRRRSAGKVYRRLKGGDIACLYDPVYLGNEKPGSRTCREELTRLGVPSFVYRGRIEANDGEYTYDGGKQASAIAKEIVAINNDIELDPVETAGHEAFHYYVETPFGLKYVDTISAQIDLSADKTKEYIKEISDNYLRKQEPNYADRKECRLVFEELFARITGYIHSGTMDSDVRAMLKDTEAVKSAWKQAVERMKAGASGAKYSLKGSDYMKGEYAPTFYSQMERTIEAAKQDKLGAASVVPMLQGKGVKAEEIKWSGIETFLEGKKSVTKQELLEFVRANSLEVTEEAIEDANGGVLPYTTNERQALDAMQEQSADLLERAVDVWEEAYHEELPFEVLTADDIGAAITRAVIDRNGGMRNYVGNDAITAQERELQTIGDQLRQIDMRQNDLADRVRARQQNTSKTHWSQYKLDGGENYREYLYKLPGSEYSNQAMEAHWGAERPGVLAHARVQDFDTPDGKMLFIEEIQSDWHNAGQKAGYGSALAADEIERIKEAAVDEFAASDVGKPIVRRTMRYFELDSESDARQKLKVEPANVGAELMAHDPYWMQGERVNAIIDLQRKLDELDLQKVPDAPFSKTYHEFVLKNLLRKAAEGGYDYLGWTTGKMQEDRWSSNYAEGYRIEYDQDIPKFLNKYGKQWGAQVGRATLGEPTMELGDDWLLDGDDLGDGYRSTPKYENGPEVWSIPITEAMKQSVLYEGQPKYSLKAGDEGATYEEAGVKHSIKSLRSDIAEGKMFDDLVRAKVFTRPEADLLKTNLDALIRYMVPNASILDMNEEYGRDNRPFGAYKPNSDPLYKISLDFSTLCRKRLMTQYVIEQLQLRENRPMSAEEQIAIRSMLLDYRRKEQALQVACAMCYVEAARLKSPKQMEAFFDNTADIMRKHFAKKNRAFNAKVVEAQKKFKRDHGYDEDAPKKDMSTKDRTAFDDMSARMRKGYTPSAEEQAIIDKAVKLPRSIFLTAGNLTNLAIDNPEIYEAYTAHIRASTRSKSLEGDIPYYYGDSQGAVSDKFIEGVNAENGMRFDSWSDFQMKHMLDMITAVIDLSVRKSKMHGYTKFPEMVRIFGKTGMQFNLSGVPGADGFLENGELFFSDTEGIDVDEAIKLRDQFPETAGLQCIGVSDEHIRALLRSDIVDYVIPYHTSGMNATLRKMAGIYGWKNYTDTQHATKDPNAKKPEGAENWQVEPVWSEFYVSEGKNGLDIMQKTAQRYIDMCHERGLIPKFDAFKVEPGYWKLLVDRKMINQKTGKIIEQQPVKPIFDFDLIKAEIDREVSKYDPDLEKRALKYIVDNFDAVHQRIKDLKKRHPKKDMLKMGNEILQAYAEGSRLSVKDSVVGDTNREHIENFGAIDPGEIPYRETEVPKKTGKHKNVSQAVRTILEAEVTPDAIVQPLAEMIRDGSFSFESIGDKESLDRAEAKVKRDGWQAAYGRWMERMGSGKVTKDDVVTGWALYNAASNAGDIKTAIDIVEAQVKNVRSAAQALQAVRVLKRMSPDAQLYGIVRSVESLVEELKQKYGDKVPDLEVDEVKAREFLRADSQEMRDEIMEEIYRDIGKQMPSTFMDKWNAWRYLAMLGNPRTHVRNIFGNLGFAPLVGAKNAIARGLEKASKTSQRTKSKVTRSKDASLLEAASEDYARAVRWQETNGKYSDAALANKYIQEGRTIFKNKGLEYARKKNSELLEKEDQLFSQRHYASALASYCKANGISEAKLRTGEGLDKAREYALREAEKATYRDVNAFSEAVGKLGRYRGKNKAMKAASLFVEGVLPFRKTPANILVRGVEYSPIGLMKGLTADLRKVKRGEMMAYEAIDNISAGLTGTGLLLLGALLGNLGVIRGRGAGDDDEREYDELKGHQAYALEVGGKSVTLDWLAPEALPLFVGVNLVETMMESKDGLTMADIITNLSNVSEPMLGMTCLQSLNDLFDGLSYAKNNGTSAIVALASSAVTSYLTQAIPTILGQAERSGQGVRMTTYTDKNNRWLTSDMQYTIGRASSRLPIVDFNQIPYIDAWGRTESSGSVVGNAFNNFLNPAYYSEYGEAEMDAELERLYNATTDAGVFPSRAGKYFTVDGVRKDLTAEEYVEYATLKGTVSRALVEAIVSQESYKRMSDEEKAKAVKECYNLANQMAKVQIAEGYDADKWVAQSQEAAQKYKISQDTFVVLKAKASAIDSLKDKNGDTIENSRGLQIMKAVYDTPGMTEAQRKAMFDYLEVGSKIKHYNKALVNQKLEQMKRQAK